MKRFYSKISLIIVFLFLFTILLSVVVIGVASVDTGYVKVLIAFDKTPGPNEHAIVKAFGGTIINSFTIVPAIAA